MKIFKQILFATSLFFTINTVVLPPMAVKAQTYSFTDSIYTSPPVASGCDDSAGFRMVFKNNSSDTLFSDKVTIYFADGVYWTEYTNGTYDHTNSTPFKLIYVFDTLPPGASIVDTYHVRGYCSVILDTINTDSIHISFTDNSGNHFYDLTNTYHIVSPYLNFDSTASVNMFLYAHYGENFRRVVAIKNTGSFKYVGGQLLFTDSLGPAIRIDSIWAVLGVDTFAKVYTNMDNIVATDNLILPDSLGVDSTLNIYESVSIIGCLDSVYMDSTYQNGNSKIHVDWGCNNSYCESMPLIQAEVSKDNILPAPTFIVINPLDDPGCEGSTKLWHIQFTNPSVVEAQNFSFNLYSQTDQYTLIDVSTVILTHDSSVNLIGIDTLLLDTNAQYYSYQCYNFVNNPLDSIRFMFSNLKQGDTIDLFYTTYKCCANDTNTLHNIINNGNPNYYTFDRWAISLYWEDECNVSYSLLQNNVTPNDAPGYIRLIQDYLPVHADMDPGVIDTFFITNTFYNTWLPDSYYSDFQNGHFVVSFMLDTGLVYVNNSAFFVNYDNSDYLYSDATVLLIDTLTTFNDTIVKVYFPLASFSSITDLYDFLLDSRIYFQLYPYCHYSRQPHVRYTVTTYLMNNNCDSCAIPLYQIEDSLSLHCKGCVTPGMIATSYSLSRITKGLKDDDDNMIIDSLAPATDSLIAHSRAIVGDTLVGILNSYLQDGESLDTGITLSNLDAFLGDSLRYCYLYTIIGNAPHLSIIHAEAVISYDSLSVDTITHDTTIFPVSDTVFGLAPHVQQNGGIFLYDISLATLHSLGFTQYTRYSIGDDFKIITTYIDDENFSNPQSVLISSITNMIWLTGIPETLSHDPFINYHEAGPPYTSLTDSSLYWCEAYGGFFYFYAVNISNTSTYLNSYNNDPCLKYVQCLASSNIGGINGYFPNHVFPFEFRQAPLLDSIAFILPTGYTLDSAYSRYDFPYYIHPNWSTYTNYHFSINYTSHSGSTYYYNIIPKYHYLDSLTDSIPPAYRPHYFDKDSIFIADEFFNYYLYVYIKPTCNATPDTTFIIDPSNDTVNILPTMVFNDADSLVKVKIDNTSWPYYELTLPTPSFELIQTPSSITADRRDNCWTFYIKNISANQTMDNLWAYDSSATGHIIIQSAYLNNISLPINSHGIIDLAPILDAGQTDTFKVCVHYICEYPLANDTMMLYYGWNCFNYPDSINQPDLCKKTSAMFTLTQESASIQAHFNQPDTVTNCTVDSMQFVIRSQSGNVYDFITTITIPTGLIYESGSSYLIYQDTTHLITIGLDSSGTTLIYYIDSISANLNLNGLGNGDSIVIKFNLINSCGYDGSIAFTGTVNAVSFCGDPINVTANTSPITVVHCDSMTIAFNFVNDLCSYDTNAFIVAIPTGGLGTLSYSWSNGATTDTIVNPPVGLLMVNITDSINCIAATYIIPSPPTPITASFATTFVSCNEPYNDGTASVSVSGGTPPYSYLWTSGGTDTIETNLSLGYDTVLITDYNGCTLNAIVYINTGPYCCYKKFIDTIPATGRTFTSSYTYPAHSEVLVLGNIIIDGTATTVTIDSNSEFIMSPGVSITIQNAGELIIDNSHLYSCDSMWYGIINNKSKLIITDSSLIEDALIGAISINDGSCHLDHSTFNKDRIGVQINGMGDANPSYIQNCNFYCKDTSGNNSACLLSPWNGSSTLEGIDLEKVNTSTSPFLVGGLGLGNNFEYMAFGVVSDNFSNTNVVENNFKRILKIGIYGLNNGALMVEEKNVFDSCYWGVTAFNKVNTAVRDNFFIDNYYGVYSIQNQNTYVTIVGNKFNTDIGFANIASNINAAAIKCWNDQNTQHFIDGNNINNESDTNIIWGILCQEVVMAAASIYDINENNIYNATFGIECDNLNNTKIYNQNPSYNSSQIYVQPNPTYNGNLTSGILVQGCNYPQIFYNYITSQSGNENYWWMNCGIRVENSNNANIYCNEAGNVSMGLWLGGLMPTPVVKGNIMDSCWDQMFLNWNPGLGIQGNLTAPSDNEWTTLPVAANTYAWNSNSSGTTFFTRGFGIYDPTINGNNIFLPCHIIDSASGSNFCSPAPDAIEYSPDERGYESRIAGDSIPWGDNLDAYKWLAKQYLFGRFKEDSTLASQNSVLQNANDSLSQTNIATIKTVADTIANADTIVVNDSLKIIQDSILQQQAIASATTINNAMDPSVTIEQNYKTVNAIYLNTIAVGIDTFTNEQQSGLINIANQCPYTGGPAVYSARIMLSIVNIIILNYDGCENYNPDNNARLMRKDSSNFVLSFGKLYPNPNDGNMQYDYNLPSGKTGELSIFNVLGVRIATYYLKLGINSLIIDQTTLSNGVYIYKVIVNNTLVSENKLIIVK